MDKKQQIIARTKSEALVDKFVRCDTSFEWADIDHSGRIVATKEGQLFASKQLKDGSVQLANLEMLHELNPQQPTKLPVSGEMKKW